MTNKLFVGNLNFQTTNDDLINTFSDFGNVQEVKIIIDRDTQKSKGFAFLTMTNESEAQKAISNLNGKEVNGRAMVVNIAKELEKKPRTNRW